MGKEKLYNVNNLYIAIYGKYKRNKDLPHVTYEAVTATGGIISEYNYYQLEYDPKTEITGIVYPCLMEKGVFKELLHGNYKVINLSSKDDRYKHGDAEYGYREKHINSFYVRKIYSLKVYYGINEKKLSLSQILSYYNKFIGKEEKNEEKPISDSILNLIIGTKEKVEASVISDEKKKEILDELFELGKSYYEKKEFYRTCSSNFQADRLALVSEYTKKVADIEFGLIGKDNNDEDIKRFIKSFN